MLFLLLGMELKMVSRIGSLKIHGEITGVTMATSRWNWGRMCAVSIHWSSVLKNKSPHTLPPACTKVKMASINSPFVCLLIARVWERHLEDSKNTEKDEQLKFQFFGLLVLDLLIVKLKFCIYKAKMSQVKVLNFSFSFLFSGVATCASYPIVA